MKYNCEAQQMCCVGAHFLKYVVPEMDHTFGTAQNIHREPLMFTRSFSKVFVVEDSFRRHIIGHLILEVMD
jgi:hypothetical protein